jgi:putative PIN family toxin of toxin-antitoxin system
MLKLVATAELVTIIEHVVACRDPTDDKFLELAINGRADRIVTGDPDLLVLNPFRGIPIVRPASFVQGVGR